MKRVCTLVGFILGTVMHAIYTVAEFFSILLIIDLLAGYDAEVGSAFLLGVVFLTFALSIVSLVLNACAINAWRKKTEGYKKKKGVVITATVFNFIVVFLIILGIANSTAGVGVLEIIMIIVLIAVNVLAYVDLGMEKGRVRKMQAQEEVFTETEE